MDKIILIGGSPTAGKSYTAKKLAEWLKLPWISTDAIRSQMRKLVREEDYPALFELAGATPEMSVEFLTSRTTEEVVKQQTGESEDVWKGVKALIETDDIDSFIIEGIAILPHLVSDLIKTNKKIKAVFLVDEDEERVRKIIFTRGLWSEASTYPDSVKEKEVEWVFAFNDHIKNEAKKYNLPVVSIGNREDYFEEVKSIIEN